MRDIRDALVERMRKANMSFSEDFMSVPKEKKPCRAILEACEVLQVEWNDMRIVRIYTALSMVFAGKQPAMRKWMYQSNIALEGDAPHELIKRGEVDKVVSYVETLAYINK